MIKISSLDLLNREVFDIDIMAKDGTVLFSSGEVITPEIILNLYFKEIYVEESFWKTDEEEIKSDSSTEDMLKQVEALNLKPAAKDEPANVEEAIEQVVVQTKEKIAEPLKFDENKAKRVAEYACMLGKLISMKEKDLKELETAAYYHNIGVESFTTDDLLKPNFKKLQADVSYNIMLKEMKVSEKIAEVAKLCIKSYNTIDFKLNEEDCSHIPYAHIVAIASHYDELLETNSKEAALAKMLQLGGNRFNIFVLHKFINMMRDDNG